MKRKLHLQFFAEEKAEETFGTDEIYEAISVEETESPEDTKTENLTENPAESTAENSPAEPTEEKSEESPLSDEIIRKIYGHIAKLEEETRELKETFPDFDLYRELKNPAFARLTAPESGIHAADAYYAIHRKEIQTLQSGKFIPKETVKRPNENGFSAQAPTVMEFDYRNASKERREALKKAIRSAAARGEKIYPK